MKQNIYEVVTDKRSIPFNQAGTGTITTFGTAIVGVGTAFLTELKAGSYLVSESQWETRRVYRVDSDTSAFMDEAFTSDLGSAAPSIIPWYLAKAVEIDLKTSSNILLDNKAFTGILNISKASRDRSSARDIVKPIMVDATGGTLNVNILY
jgi:hypothetical protein